MMNTQIRCFFSRDVCPIQTVYDNNFAIIILSNKEMSKSKHESCVRFIVSGYTHE